MFRYTATYSSAYLLQGRFQSTVAAGARLRQDSEVWLAATDEFYHPRSAVPQRRGREGYNWRACPIRPGIRVASFCNESRYS